ncbi:hypothetical protein [Escherichia coli]
MAPVSGVKDSHDDVVMSGAFAASLRAWSDRKALPGAALAAPHG